MFLRHGITALMFSVLRSPFSVLRSPFSIFVLEGTINELEGKTNTSLIERYFEELWDLILEDGTFQEFVIYNFAFAFVVLSYLYFLPSLLASLVSCVVNRALRSGLTTPMEEDDDSGGGGGETGETGGRTKSKKMAPTLSIGRLWLASLGGKVIVTNLTFTTLSSSIHIKRVVIIMRWWKGLWCVGKIRTAEPFGDPTYPLQYRYVAVQLDKDCLGY
jgi:hypothetical protein